MAASVDMFDGFKVGDTVTVTYAIHPGTGTLRFISVKAASDASSTTLGDVNGDGAIDILDVIATNKFLLGVKQFDEAAQAAGDVNGDNTITSDDALQILKFALQMIDKF